MEPTTPEAIDPAAVATAERTKLSPLSERRMRRILGRSRSATSQHLRVLREADIVQPSRNGNVVRYRLATDLNAEILRDIDAAFDKLEPGSTN